MTGRQEVIRYAADYGGEVRDTAAADADGDPRPGGQRGGEAACVQFALQRALKCRELRGAGRSVLPEEARLKYSICRDFRRDRKLIASPRLRRARGSLGAQTKPVFTENFESGKIDPAVWDTRTMGTSTIAVEPSDGAHGKYALHVHYPDTATGSYAFVVATHLPDSVQKHFFGRAYMKITPGVGTTHNPLIFAGEPGWQLSKFEEIGTSRGNWMPSFQENKSTGKDRGEITYHADTPPPFDKWFLLEWEFNDDPASITMWVDGEKVITTVDGQKMETVKFAWPKGTAIQNRIWWAGLRSSDFGTRVWGAPMKGFDVYYDDIAIGTSRIGK